MTTTRPVDLGSSPSDMSGPGHPRRQVRYGLTHSDFVAMGGTTRPVVWPCIPDPAPELIPPEGESSDLAVSRWGRIHIDSAGNEALRVHYDRLH